MTHRHNVVAGLLQRDQSVLLCKRQSSRAWYPGVWDLPGGHLAVGEDPRAALTRELREELGIATVIVGSPWLEAETDEAQVTIFKIADWTGTVRNVNKAEHSRVSWFSPDATGGIELGPLATHLFNHAT